MAKNVQILITRNREKSWETEKNKIKKDTKTMRENQHREEREWFLPSNLCHEVTQLTSISDRFLASLTEELGSTLRFLGQGWLHIPSKHRHSGKGGIIKSISDSTSLCWSTSSTEGCFQHVQHLELKNFNISILDISDMFDTSDIFLIYFWYTFDTLLIHVWYSIDTHLNKDIENLSRSCSAFFSCSK